MGLHGPTLVRHRRAVLEIADPQGAGLIPRPAAAATISLETPSFRRVAPCCRKCRYKVERGS